MGSPSEGERVRVVTGALPTAARDLAAAMAELGQPWMVIGGIAVIAHGVPRATIDVDATVLAAGTTPASLLAALERHAFAARIPDAVRFALDHQVLLVAHQLSGVPVDITLAWMPFEEEALGRAEWTAFAGGTLPVIALEDLIVYKLVAARQRDLDDVERLLDAHGDRIDRAHVTRSISDFCSLLEDASRMGTWERLQREHGQE